MQYPVDPCSKWTGLLIDLGSQVQSLVSALTDHPMHQMLTLPKIRREEEQASYTFLDSFGVHKHLRMEIFRVEMLHIE